MVKCSGQAIFQEPYYMAISTPSTPTKSHMDLDDDPTSLGNRYANGHTKSLSRRYQKLALLVYISIEQFLFLFDMFRLDFVDVCLHIVFGLSQLLDFSIDFVHLFVVCHLLRLRFGCGGNLLSVEVLDVLVLD